MVRLFCDDLSGDGSGTAIFSGRRDGFALYFARLVRPLWKNKLTKPGLAKLLSVCQPQINIHNSSSAGGLQQSNIGDSMLVTVQKNLYALKDFLDKNPHLFHSSPGEPTVSRPPAGHEQEAWKVCLSLGVKIIAI